MLFPSEGSISFTVIPALALRMVEGTAALGLEIPHGFQQSRIVLLAPHHDGIKQGWRCNHAIYFHSCLVSLLVCYLGMVGKLACLCDPTVVILAGVLLPAGSPIPDRSRGRGHTKCRPQIVFPVGEEGCCRDSVSPVLWRCRSSAAQYLKRSVMSMHILFFVRSAWQLLRSLRSSWPSRYAFHQTHGSWEPEGSVCPGQTSASNSYVP